jgi:hypothetical protein
VEREGGGVRVRKKGGMGEEGDEAGRDRLYGAMMQCLPLYEGHYESQHPQTW